MFGKTLVSITAPLVATAFYYPWSLHQSGFGSFKQPPLVVWLVGSVVLFVLRKASPRPARG